MQGIPRSLRRSPLLLAAALVPFLAACAASASRAAEPAVPQVAFTPAEMKELVVGALARVALPAARADGNELAVHVVGLDAPLPRSANGLELVPVAAFAWSADRPCAELAITKHGGEELVLEVRVANPIGGPTVTALRFTRRDGRWSCVETLGVTEYL